MRLERLLIVAGRGKGGAYITGFNEKSVPVFQKIRFPSWVIDERVEASDDQHGIAIAEKSVSFFYCLLIGFHYQVITAESTHHDQQAGLRQVEVRDHGVGNMEVIGRINEQVRPALCRFE